jgi:hypothetical protein
MKKNLMISISILIIAILALSACTNKSQTVEVDPASQTQVAIFAQATLTKYAELQPTAAATDEPTPEPEATPVSEEEEPTEEPSEEPTDPPANETEAPTAEATAIPQPTTPASLPEPPAGSERISFAAGTTNKTTSGTVEANQTKQFVFWVGKGQLFEVNNSGDNAGFIAVKSPSGKVLVDFDNRWLWYRDYAQETGDYVIQVSGLGYKSNFNLKLIAPQKLEFARGTNSLTAKATVPANYGHEFSFWAGEGQKMNISLNPADQFVLSIMNADGTVILSAASNANSFEGDLPKAGTYVVTMHNTTGAAVSADFTLTIK